MCICVLLKIHCCCCIYHSWKGWKSVY